MQTGEKSYHSNSYTVLLFALQKLIPLLYLDSSI